MPERTTSYLQPLDVSVNAPFKRFLRDQWDDWFENTPHVYIKKGNIKRAGYGTVVDWVHNASESIDKAVITKSFEACGLSQKRQINQLNSRLMDLMKNETHLMSFADDEDWDADMEEEFAEYGSLQWNMDRRVSFVK